jgi:allophanate hydrolase subunit 2
MVTGAVQVPPGGEPIILMPDHATVGGYPVVACVITADLPVLGQLAPGDPVGFAVVGHQTAGKARRSASEALGRQVTGWYPTRAGT